jgi:hypothetical protein
MVMRSFLQAAQTARVKLSNEREVTISPPAVDCVSMPPALMLSRKKMETLCSEPLRRLLQVRGVPRYELYAMNAARRLRQGCCLPFLHTVAAAAH